MKIPPAKRKKEHHRTSHEHLRLQPSNVPHAIAHLVPRLEWLELRPFSLRSQFLRTLPILPTGPHTLLNNSDSLSVGHVDMSLCTLGREMSVVDSRDCLQ